MGEDEYEEECAEIPKVVGVWHGSYSLALYYIGFVSTWHLNEGQIGDTLKWRPWYYKLYSL